jgi:WD40 repeat protein
LIREKLSGVERRPDLGVLRPSSVAFSPDGNRFAIGSYSGFVKLFHTSTLNEMATFRGFLQGVHSVAFSPDGRRLATGGSGFEAIRFWDIETGRPLLTLEAAGSAFNSTALWEPSRLQFQPWRAPHLARAILGRNHSRQKFRNPGHGT